MYGWQLGRGKIAACLSSDARVVAAVNCGGCAAQSAVRVKRSVAENWLRSAIDDSCRTPRFTKGRAASGNDEVCHGVTSEAIAACDGVERSRYDEGCVDVFRPRRRGLQFAEFV